MKLKIEYAFALSIGFLLVLFFASNSSTPYKTNGSKTIMSTSNTTNHGDNIILSRDSITASIAHGRMNLYQEFIDPLRETVPHGCKLVYGVKLHMNELKTIVDDVKYKNDLYIMLGYDAGEGWTDMIHCVQDSASGKWEYYDFTHPCPSYCPDNWLTISACNDK